MMICVYVVCLTLALDNKSKTLSLTKFSIIVNMSILKHVPSGTISHYEQISLMAFTIPEPETIEVSSSNRHLPISKVGTFAPGTRIPILCKDVLPGDKFRINIDSLIESLPMIAPNLQGYKVSFDFYFEPWANLYGWMDNNKRSSTQEILDRVRHTYSVYNNTSGAYTVAKMVTRPGVKAGSLLDYLGVPVGFVGDPVSQSSTNGVAFVPHSFPAEKLLAVLDIYRNYYVNNQEEYCYFIYSNNTNKRSLVPRLLPVHHEDLDNLFMVLRQQTDGVAVEALDTPLKFPPVGYDEILTLGDLITAFIKSSLNFPLGGLPLATYRMDLNRGIMSSKIGTIKSTVTLRDGGFSIDTLRFANKMQKLIDRIDISGGRFSDMMRARWGVTPRGQLDIPDYLGSCSDFFGVTDIIATASGTNANVENDRGNSILGQQAGFAVNRLRRDNQPISFRSDQYGTLICMMSLVPIVTYSQGIEREDLKTTFAEVYDPAFAQLGYQDVDPRELSAIPSFDLHAVNDPTQPLQFANDALMNRTSVGKRIAWSEYMSALPRAHGLFAYGQDFDYWANNRLYTKPQASLIAINDENAESIAIAESYGPTDFSTYIDPAIQNNLFADTSMMAQNFRFRANFDIFVRRNIGSRVMPHL